MCKQHCWHELRQHAIKRWLERAKKTSYICTYHLVQFTDSPVFFSIIQPNGKSLVCAPLPLETFVCWLILNEHKSLIMRRWFNWYLKLFYCHSSSELISNELRKCTHKSGAQTFHMKIYNILICLSPRAHKPQLFRGFSHCVAPPLALCFCFKSAANEIQITNSHIIARHIRFYMYEEQIKLN